MTAYCLPDGREVGVTTTDQIVAALGGSGALRSRVHTLDQLRGSILRGLPFQAFEAVSANYGLPKPAVSRVLRVPERTLMRRKRRALFPVDESDRLVRLARIAALAEDVLGRRDKAGRWLQKPNRALGGATPLEQLDTELGARQVEQILGRIGHGVIS
jgi:putative toxin-antitoxin system antitoxin component (TIGR02293 family)